MSEWNKYPETKPPIKWEEGVPPSWFLVKMDDGSVEEACWWLDGWYCFGESYKIVGWKEKG